MIQYSFSKHSKHPFIIRYIYPTCENSKFQLRGFFCYFRNFIDSSGNLGGDGYDPAGYSCQ